MCMLDIQSATAEIRQGKRKKKERRKKETTGRKYDALLHRAAVSILEEAI